MSQSNRIAVLVCGRESMESERCLARIVDFFGIESRTVEAERLDSGDCVAMPVGSSRYSILVSARELARVLAPAARFPQWLTRAESVFVFDFDVSEASTQLLRQLTGLDGAGIISRQSPGCGHRSVPQDMWSAFRNCR